jgi:hypothetical protein
MEVFQIEMEILMVSLYIPCWIEKKMGQVAGAGSRDSSE